MSNLFITLIVIAVVLHKMGLLMPLTRRFGVAAQDAARRNAEGAASGKTPSPWPAGKAPGNMDELRATLARAVKSRTVPQPAKPHAKPAPRTVPTVQRMTGPLAEKRFFRW